MTGEPMMLKLSGNCTTDVRTGILHKRILLPGPYNKITGLTYNYDTH